ncbi:hypothetical protein DIPPA_06789, partial [Diplonema papillatum]
GGKRRGGPKTNYPNYMDFDDSSDEQVVPSNNHAKEDTDFEDDDSDSDEFAMDGLLPSKSEPPLPALIPPSKQKASSAFTPAPVPLWRISDPAAPVKWERLAEWESLPVSISFCAPLEGKPVDIWPGKSWREEAIVLYKTPDGLLGKMLIKRLNATLLRIRFRTDNTIFPTANLQPYCAHEVEVTLIDHSTLGDRQHSFLDLSLGGFGWDVRTFRQAVRSKTPGVTILPPDIGFFLHHESPESTQAQIPFLYPCRSTLVHVWDKSCDGAIMKLLRSATLAWQDDDGSVNNFSACVYGGMRRSIEQVTHFSQEQIAAVWEMFLRCSDSGREDVKSGMQVFLTLENLPVFLEQLLPSQDLIPPDADPSFAAMVSVFLKSDALQEGLWWLLSDPVGAGYKTMTPTAKRANRCIKFFRVMEVLNVAMFGVKDQIVELLVQLLTPGQEVLSRADLKRFLVSAFEGEDTDQLAEMFDDLFTEDVTSLAIMRHSFVEMDVFQTWNELIFPLLQARSWCRSNPDL